MKLVYTVYGFLEIEQSGDSIHPTRHYFATAEVRNEQMKLACAKSQNACYAFDYEKEIDV